MAAKRFSAEVSVARLVRGVTTSAMCTSAGTAGLRTSSATRMHHSIGRGVRGSFGKLTRRGGGQTMLGRTGLNGQRQARSARKQQALTFTRSEQILAFFGCQPECVRDGIDRRRVLLQQ